MEILINQSIGDYGVLREIGSGGMGRVYEAIHSVTHRHEALKVLDATAPTSEVQSERFLREIRLQAALSHPNIAAVHNAFWNEDSLVLVCELLQGEPLQVALERGRLSLARSVEVLSEVLSALSYAHARGVIHRDISPSNIFVTAASGSVKLIDFGLAKTTSDLNLTQPGQPAGSYHYMSPEQVRGGQSLDARVDIYGCGAVLFELVTGRRVFPGDSAFDLMQAQCERTPDAPRSLNPDLPKELEDVILKALAKNPEDRFQSADSFAKALAQVRLGVTAPAVVPQSPRPNARAYAVGLSLAVAVAAAGAFYPMLHTKASAAAPKTDRLAVTAPASVQTAPQVTPPVEQQVVAAPPAVVAPPRPVPQARPAVATVARATAPSPRPQASPAVVAEPEPSTTEFTEIETPEVSVAPTDPPPTPEAVDPKTPNKVTRAIKRLNPFRKK